MDVAVDVESPVDVGVVLLMINSLHRRELETKKTYASVNKSVATLLETEPPETFGTTTLLTAVLGLIETVEVPESVLVAVPLT